MSTFHQTHDVITADLFWHAINILVTKPHVINKRLWGCKLLGRYIIHCIYKNTWESWTLPVKLHDPSNIDMFVGNLMSGMQSELVSNENSNFESEIIIRELLPKNYGEKHAFQVIFLQRNESMATFYDVTPVEHQQNLVPKCTYKFYLLDETVRLLADADDTSKSYQWLKMKLLPQVIKWSQEGNQTTGMSINKSLALVQHDQYYIKYNDLKEKYGKELVKIWPECTDPSKFVYEDIAIATYLLLLWEENYDDNDTVTSQRFVDMGCGNGLLVYILTMEGHSGYGIDIRKRKIWDMYPEKIKLLEQTITPSNINMFTDVDWIIGNHSDELTPWIPVIAARSSYKCKFFLLPCCAYNFNGTKYQRVDSSKAQYSEYLEYIQKLSEDCGFQTYTDRLKIPSTKRICFVGKKRKHQEDEYEKYCESIKVIIKTSTCTNSANINETNDTENFKPREAIEKVRNCTQIDKKVIESIISCVSKYLLEGCELSKEWSPGKVAEISEIVSLITPETLKLLKSECGGLQTLFRNNPQIFKVKGGKIQLQYPKSVEEMNMIARNNKRYKTNVKLKVRECWFYKNHPQGCPLQDTECSFLHSK